MDNDSQRILDRIRAYVAAYNTRSSASAPSGPQHAFLPIGEHLMRSVLDPTGKLSCHVPVHRTRDWKRWTHCPDALKKHGPPGDYPSCAICALATQRDDWWLPMEEVTLMYGHLYMTRQPSLYWQPGQAYVLVLRATLAETIRAQLDTWLGLDTQAEAVGAMLQPHVAGPALRVSVKGPGRSLTLALTAETYPPIILGDWYKPLIDCWIGQEFNLTEYQAVLAALTGSA